MVQNWIVVLALARDVEKFFLKMQNWTGLEGVCAVKGAKRDIMTGIKEMFL